MNGWRAGAPKAFVQLVRSDRCSNAPLDGLRDSGVVDAVVVAVPAESHRRGEADPRRRRRRRRGRRRTAPSRSGCALAAVGDAEFVLVHDAARALTPPALIARVVRALRAGHDRRGARAAGRRHDQGRRRQRRRARHPGARRPAGRADPAGVSRPSCCAAPTSTRARAPVTDDASMVERPGRARCRSSTATRWPSRSPPRWICCWPRPCWTGDRPAAGRPRHRRAPDRGRAAVLAAGPAVRRRRRLRRALRRRRRRPRAVRRAAAARPASATSARCSAPTTRAGAGVSGADMLRHVRGLLARRGLPGGQRGGAGDRQPAEDRPAPRRGAAGALRSCSMRRSRCRRRPPTASA